MNTKRISSAKLAAEITKKASKQTYYTIRLLVDRDRVDDASRAYAYFRWVDDTLDQPDLLPTQRIDFLNRQISLVESSYRGDRPGEVCAEERILVDLIASDPRRNTGLHAYIQDMMAVMAFDTNRRGRLISQEELDQYTHDLSSAVTDAMHYFIGNRCSTPASDGRYLSATAAHIAHMLRDTVEDNAAGYFNIPEEILDIHGITPADIDSEAFRLWVRQRVERARNCIETGKAYLSQVKNLRCRIAGYAYTARFEWILDRIEKDRYRIKDAYPERQSLAAISQIIWMTLSQFIQHSMRRRFSQPSLSRIKPSVGEM